MSGIKTNKGFTLVELLIVIVVVAILAAISVVSYQGVNARAADARIKATANDVGKTLVLADISSGERPTAQGYFSNPSGVDDFVKVRGLQANYRDGITSSNTIGANTVFRYYRCGEGLVIYASLNNPTTLDTQSFQDARIRCGHTDVHAPVSGNYRYNYAKLFG